MSVARRRVEARELDLPIQAFAGLAQEQEPERASREAEAQPTITQLQRTTRTRIESSQSAQGGNAYAYCKYSAEQSPVTSLQNC